MPPDTEAAPLADSGTWAVGYVYLVETDPPEFHKIGFSRKPSVRARTFTRMPFEMTVTHIFPVGTPACERYLLCLFGRRGRRVRGEWFRLTADEVAALKAVAHAQSVAELKALLAV